LSESLTSTRHARAPYRGLLCVILRLNWGRPQTRGQFSFVAEQRGVR
jgi:hypothetical protein